MIPDPYADRSSYRVLQGAGDLTYFRVSVDETDLSIGARRDLGREALAAVLEARRQVTAQIEDRPRFRTSLEPLRPHGTESPLIRQMLEAGSRAGVGPMAAVAGAIARTCVAGHIRRIGADEVLNQQWVAEEGGLYIVFFHKAHVCLLVLENFFASHDVDAGREE